MANQKKTRGIKIREKYEGPQTKLEIYLKNKKIQASRSPAAQGGRATHGYGKAYLKGGKV